MRRFKDRLKPTKDFKTRVSSTTRQPAADFARSAEMISEEEYQMCYTGAAQIQGDHIHFLSLSDTAPSKPAQKIYPGRGIELDARKLMGLDTSEL